MLVQPLSSFLTKNSAVPFQNYTKVDGTHYLALRMQKTLPLGTLIVETSDGPQSIPDFFTYDSYVRLGVTYKANHFKIYKDLTMVLDINYNCADESNSVNLTYLIDQEMYVGGDESNLNYFQGYIKQLTVWEDDTLNTFPLNTAVDQGSFAIYIMNKFVVCDEEMYHTTQFDVGPDYYWPASSYFGDGWFHVRRLAPTGNSAGWFYMKNGADNYVSDVLAGSAISQTQSEAEAYSFNQYLFHRFGQPSLTTASTGQYVRYYAPWNIQEYLIVTGDRSAWVRFTAADLQDAITAGTGLTTYPACVNIRVTSTETSNPIIIKALFMSSGQEFYVGPYSASCPNPLVSLWKQKLQDYNDNTAPIYGETATLSSPSLTNNLLARDGVNVFVRLSPADYPRTI
eukprot:TRINITY_DN173_c3_g1_i10.p3 TRINITY_DN173_c3_g1~~TRINITY_DN173_c3_g1_i10.p3  ORF type:complete len:398 (-),score=10.37 TRINITY_DN173_c3_g1_i10:4465-5658(-)